MRNGEDIVREFLDSHAEYENDFTLTTYDEEPILLVTYYNGKAEKFFEEFNSWFKRTDEFKEFEEENYPIYDYDTFIIEHLGVQIGNDDEYSYCSNCGKLIHIIDSSGCRDDNYWLGDGFILCEECIRNDMETYINEYLVLNYETGVPVNNLPINTFLSEDDLKEYGFIRLDGEYYFGMYEHGNTNPIAAMEKMIEDNKESDFIFNQVYANPFEVCYEIWKREKKEDDE